MLSYFATRFGQIFDWLDDAHQRRLFEKTAVRFAAAGFLLHLLLILLARSIPALGSGLLSDLDKNFLHAVYTPFSVILFLEVILLVLALPQSHTSSIGKQYEIISLIVVRRVFKDIGEFRDLGSWLEQIDATQAILYDMIAAVLMFFIVTLFYQIRKKVTKSKTHRDLKSFILVKKVIAVLLIGVLFALAAYNLLVWVQGTLPCEDANAVSVDWDLFFFPAFYEFMIFTDVFLLILSISYYERYEYVFRNAGFVISTVLIRYSFSTTKPYDVVLALIAMVYGLAVLGIFALFTRVVSRNSPTAKPSAS